MAAAACTTSSSLPRLGGLDRFSRGANRNHLGIVKPCLQAAMFDAAVAKRADGASDITPF
ncbi:hypothetical protein PU630_16395 [Microbacterium horticulturae]|uniref:Uncharacterized protein n=1 Tax=Microbacterium horticulturae TaxID=3028316 RepID=A0ABY8BXA4_9MICO|nr:hypothetical protein [Microbacterium sp. KACC 23027]WEG08798.1 hypothetical protein PU630_16395 [Microbacterium sp. KACC 23027]